MKQFRNIGIILFVLFTFMGTMAACAGGGGGDNGEENAVPVADAGSDRAVKTGYRVDLDGSGSSDGDGDPLTYSWEFTAFPGDEPTLGDSTTATPYFTPDVDGAYVVSLVVNDGYDDSDPDTVTLTAAANEVPVADAGSNRVVKTGYRVDLDGSGSSDGDGDPLTYSWEFTAFPGDEPTLWDSNTVSPYFTADEDGSYIVSLVVNDGYDDSDPDTVTLTANGDEVDLGSVLPFYSNGPNWNDYVDNDGSDIFLASNTVASRTGTGGYTSVIHGGEMRTVNIPGVIFCDGITAFDTRGFFNWTCLEGTDSLTDPAKIVSTGLANGISLSDLIDFETPYWKENRVTVLDEAEEYGYTSSDYWWAGNPVYEVFDPSLALTTESAIYAVASSLVGDLVIDGDKVALVTGPGVMIRGETQEDNVVRAEDGSFLWIEAEMMDALGSTGSGDILSLTNIQFSVLRNISIGGSGTDSGVHLYESHNNLMNDIAAFSNSEFGIWLENSRENRLYALRVANNYIGLEIDNSNGNIVYGLTSNNHSNRGVRLLESRDNILSNITSGNNHYGCQLYKANRNVLSNITVTNNYDAGMVVQLSSYNSIADLAGVNNEFGLHLYDSADYNIFNNVAVGHNLHGIRINDSSYNRFTGVLEVGNNSAYECTVTGGMEPGLDSITCDNSEAVLTTDVYFSDSFVAEVTSDSVNTSPHINGMIDYQDITDWVGFENVYRVWGKDGINDFPDQTNRNFGLEEMCIWDWSLDVTDPELALLDALSEPSGSDTLTHTWSDNSQTEFLKNALEIIEDSVGNDDGLCEALEDCIFTPNLGSYQGHDELVYLDTVTITGGDVDLYVYQTNGR